MTLAKKAASIAARSTVRARSIHRSRSFNSAWRAWRVVFMPKGEYAGVWRGVSGSFHSDGVSRSRGRPPGPPARLLCVVRAQLGQRSTRPPRAPSGARRRRRARRPSCPRRRGSHRPCASSRRQRRTRSTRLPSSALAPSRLWRDHARPRSRPARQRARPSRIPRPGRSCGNPCGRGCFGRQHQRWSGSSS